MRHPTFLTSLSAASLLITALATAPALADGFNISLLGAPEGKGKKDQVVADLPAIDTAVPRDWMHGDVPLAWIYPGTFETNSDVNDPPYHGARNPLKPIGERGVSITFVDDFSTGNQRAGNLGDGAFSLQHGEWTSREGAMIAPLADIGIHDVYSGKTVTLPNYTGVFNILNLSYSDEYNPATAEELYKSGNLLSVQEKSIIELAKSGNAFVAKSAGNNSDHVNNVKTAVGDPVTSLVAGRGRPQYVTVKDYLSVGLMDAESTASFSGVWVGALDSNSTVSYDNEGGYTVLSTASIANYSNIAGTDTRVQDNYLMVGVEATNNGGLEGTSFAAPIISGYAAILASKFKAATPLQVKNQLLQTARIETIANYSVDVHGQGEASIYRAVAPISITGSP